MYSPARVPASSATSVKGGREREREREKKGKEEEREKRAEERIQQRGRREGGGGGRRGRYREPVRENEVRKLDDGALACPGREWGQIVPPFVVWKGG